MITEDALRELLAEAADAAPAPGRAPEDLFAALAGDAAEADADGPSVRGLRAVPMALRGQASTKVLGIAAAVLLVVAVVGVAIAGNDDGARHVASDTVARESAALSTTIPAGGDEFAAPAPDVATGTGGSTGGTTGGSGAPALGAPTVASKDADAGGSVAPTAAGAPTDSAKVVKTGSLDLEVRKGAFDRTVNAIVTKAVGLHGYVADQTTSVNDSAPAGTITVRVPSESFDQLLADLRKLGKVRGVSQKGTEVSAQYTDLQARLTAVTATRDRLNVVLSKATTVTDILSVQDRITQVQTEIEQLQGQMRLLDDQASMGTLAVSVTEPGGKVETVPNPDDRTIGSSWEEARHRFGNGVEAVIAWSGSAGVWVLFGGVVLVLGRLLWPRLRRLLLL